jgi:flagellar protein FlbD
MIYVTRLNHSTAVLNSDLIEHIETTPDTVITLTTGQRLTVRETPAELIESVRAWRHSILLPEGLTAPRPNEPTAEIPELSAAGEDSKGYRHGGL